MKKFVVFVISFFSILLVVTPHLASAQEAINSFHVDMTAQKNGDLLVSEKIEYTFGTQFRHGIYRTIPLISHVGELYRVITINFTNVLRDEKKENFKVDNTGDQVQIKIGDPDRTISGPHIYQIDYLVKNGIGSNYTDHDEIYWNVTGNEWTVPISSATFALHTDFGVPIKKAACFTGVVGSKESNCDVVIENGEVSISSQSFFSSSEGLTVVAGFPVNTFPKSTLQKSIPMDPDLRAFLITFAVIYVVLNLIVAPYLLWWYLKKKNKTKYGPAVVNFDLPESKQGERISPAEAGTIDNTKLEKEDIVATIFDLAIRKYIKIEGVIKKTKFGLGEKEEFSLMRLKANAGLNQFESYLLDKLFAGKRTTTLQSAKLSYSIFTDLESKNFATLISRNFYTKNPKSQKSACLVLGMLTLSFGCVILGPILLYLSRKLNGRTELGDEMDWKLDGLKIFLRATKRYDVWQTKNFIFLEKMIPYAMSLGVIDQYMKELKILKPSYSPSWYSGRGNFYAMYPLFSHTASSNVTTTAPASSSGFSGGSSGGGGGGGGGGSW